MCCQDINKGSPIRGGRVMGVIGASLALLDTDLSSFLCIAFVIHLLLCLPTAFPSSPSTTVISPLPPSMSVCSVEPRDGYQSFYRYLTESILKWLLVSGQTVMLVVFSLFYRLLPD